MQNLDYYYLNSLIGGHFNQDYYLINDREDTIEGIARFFKKSVTNWVLKEVVKEIDSFVSTYGKNIEEEFEKRFGFDFGPELWGTTAHGFLMTVRKIMLEETNLQDLSPDEKA